MNFKYINTNKMKAYYSFRDDFLFMWKQWNWKEKHPVRAPDSDHFQPLSCEILLCGLERDMTVRECMPVWWKIKNPVTRHLTFSSFSLNMSLFFPTNESSPCGASGRPMH